MKNLLGRFLVRDDRNRVLAGAVLDRVAALEVRHDVAAFLERQPDAVSRGQLDRHHLRRRAVQFDPVLAFGEVHCLVRTERAIGHDSITLVDAE